MANKRARVEQPLAQYEALLSQAPSSMTQASFIAQHPFITIAKAYHAPGNGIDPFEFGLVHINVLHELYRFALLPALCDVRRTFTKGGTTSLRPTLYAFVQALRQVCVELPDASTTTSPAGVSDTISTAGAGGELTVEDVDKYLHDMEVRCFLLKPFKE